MLLKKFKKFTFEKENLVKEISLDFDQYIGKADHLLSYVGVVLLDYKRYVCCFICKQALTLITLYNKAFKILLSILNLKNVKSHTSLVWNICICFQKYAIFW